MYFLFISIYLFIHLLIHLLMFADSVSALCVSRNNCATTGAFLWWSVCRETGLLGCRSQIVGLPVFSLSVFKSLF